MFKIPPDEFMVKSRGVQAFMAACIERDIERRKKNPMLHQLLALIQQFGR